MNQIIIKQGNHFSEQMPKIFWKRQSLKFNCLFEDSCRYTIDYQNQMAWNKLSGIQFGIGLHWNKKEKKVDTNIHKQSYRIAWRYNHVFDKIELAEYWYNNSNEYQFRIIGQYYLNSKIIFDIYFNRNTNLIFTNINGISRRINFNFTNSGKLNFLLHPYFGGQVKAPHDIKIQLEYV